MDNKSGGGGGRASGRWGGRGGLGWGGSGGGKYGSGSGSGGENYPCLTMHQPWASLLVHGIKRIEGRSWPAPLTGRLWIHAASKVPEPETIKQMENFYREIYAVNGIIDINFPKNYPISRLLGCVEIVGCLKGDELAHWEEVPESVRLEALTNFCWLCEKPQKLVVPLEMRGYQGVYNLEKRIYEAAVRGLTPVAGPLPAKFPLPDPQNPLSLKPGSLQFTSSKASEVKKSESISTAIAGARAAATQFSRKDERWNNQIDALWKRDNSRSKEIVAFHHRANRAEYHHLEMRASPTFGSSKILSAALKGISQNH
ncbi:hypothetical protein HPP92_025225 [Vanilla planifolia]|uniref:ASCH domain-containing protein n=1 Tax=Vanilla planifolia TaxID=51239 RepID=A0A835PHH3_VANPL|nr:hypothetical protein HPP92_025225 [Vanilla planifolia]